MLLELTTNQKGAGRRDCDHAGRGDHARDRCLEAARRRAVRPDPRSSGRACPRAVQVGCAATAMSSSSAATRVAAARTDSSIAAYDSGRDRRHRRLLRRARSRAICFRSTMSTGKRPSTSGSRRRGTTSTRRSTGPSDYEFGATLRRPGPIAQLGERLAWHARGRRFEPDWVHVLALVLPLAPALAERAAGPRRVADGLLRLAELAKQFA